MNCRTTVLVMFAALALTACGGGEDENEGSKDGIYQLELVRESDTCTPKRSTGDFGQVPLTHEPDQYTLFYPLVGEGEVPIGFFIERVPKDRPFEKESVGIHDCPELRRWMSLELLSDVGPVEVRYKTRYSDMASCGLTSESRFEGLPDSDCEASLLLRYSLVQVCEEPCTIRPNPSPESSPGTYICDCK
ncbi:MULTISPECIES: hypothetical protein [Myxococcus]|uniref:hypothetical protein n=1 Tax=Myxococcus TaxID=32 RepID=UPI0013D38AE0|nr:MULTISPECIES: hypothetical protein [Myxococcus]NVJ21581.1 hypothetical protein [Myxococcus sp. AM011]